MWDCTAMREKWRCCVDLGSLVLYSVWIVSNRDLLWVNCGWSNGYCMCRRLHWFIWSLLIRCWGGCWQTNFFRFSVWKFEKEVDGLLRNSQRENSHALLGWRLLACSYWLPCSKTFGKDFSTRSDVLLLFEKA